MTTQQITQRLDTEQNDRDNLVLALGALTSYPEFYTEQNDRDNSVLALGALTSYAEFHTSA